MTTAMIVLGVLSILLTGVHAFGGGKEVLEPVMALSGPAPVPRETMRVCWHGITVVLLVSGVGFLWAASNAEQGVGAARLLSTINLGFAGLFLWTAWRSRIPGGWLKLGQWIAFLPMGVAGWAATLL